MAQRRRDLNFSISIQPGPVQHAPPMWSQRGQTRTPPPRFSSPVCRKRIFSSSMQSASVHDTVQFQLTGSKAVLQCRRPSTTVKRGIVFSLRAMCLGTLLDSLSSYINKHHVDAPEQERYPSILIRYPCRLLCSPTLYLSTHDISGPTPLTERASAGRVDPKHYPDREIKPISVSSPDIASLSFPKTK